MTPGLLQGKTAIVTGAGSGMGKAAARLFAQQGANVVLADLNEQAAEQAAVELNRQQALVIRTDVTDDDSVKEMVSETLETFGHVDVLVNSAGVAQVFTPVEQLSPEQWDKIMNVNAKSVFLTSRHVVPFMKKRMRGTIINIASIAGVRARPGLNAYCASKGAVILFTKALALELAPYQIRVNAINPGPAETPMLGQFLSGDAGQAEEQKRKIFLESVPLRRLIQPEEIAQAALYLASDLAKSVTGEIMNVDGGRGI
ncbi:SDR family oxidoreductase [Lihuaxuella thermophila]|uniref:3-oxoacyl-[acyl-carrier protein] reductase n=1 Tax=Lihuaxuella thermophila TaxID=1173111 RepID=A0A1H8EJT5_9BACL|nr:SDR family oxidoreductase [Lihuaxuella thermophila]SEN19743.1 3-oxoacyl-[acyl-carrier protein] reductase [Lihuaxuella thermophila]